MTDGELHLLDEGIDLIIKPPDEALDPMPDVVRKCIPPPACSPSCPAGSR